MSPDAQQTARVAYNAMWTTHWSAYYMCWCAVRADLNPEACPDARTLTSALVLLAETHHGCGGLTLPGEAAAYNDWLREATGFWRRVLDELRAMDNRRNAYLIA